MDDDKESKDGLPKNQMLFKSCRNTEFFGSSKTALYYPAGVMVMVMILGIVGSFIMGLVDTAIGTKKAIVISCVILSAIFSPKNVKKVDDKRRVKVGKELDDALVGRK